MKEQTVYPGLDINALFAKADSDLQTQHGLLAQLDSAFADAPQGLPDDLSLLDLGNFEPDETEPDEPNDTDYSLFL
jgi:hypothetical protein